MPKFPATSPQEIIKCLEKNGYILQRQKGSHVIFWHPKKRKHVTVPLSKKELPIGTLKSILRMAEISF